MRLSGVVATAILAGGTAIGQATVTHAFDLRGALTTASERDDADPGPQAGKRLAALIGKLVTAEGKAANQLGRMRLVQLVSSRNRVFLFVRGEQNDIDLVNGILKQLRLPEHPKLRVQCTLLTVPATLARAHGLARGKPVPVDEAKAGEILKQCTQQGGTLQNLPEGHTFPLQPFAIRPRARQTDRKWCVQCEGLMVDADSAAFTVRLVEDRPKLPRAERIAETFRIEPGSGMMLASRPLVQRPKPDQAIVLWFRFICAEVPERMGKDHKKTR